MVSILSNEYLLGGATGASLWALGDTEFDKECSTLDPGSLILLFKNEGERNYIVGGGYFLGWAYMPISQAWDLYGVHNGAYNLDDLIQDVINRGGNKDSELSIAMLVHTFMFDTQDYVHVPDAISLAASTSSPCH